MRLTFLLALWTLVAADAAAQQSDLAMLTRPHPRRDADPIARRAQLAKFARPAGIPSPEDNPLTPAKVALGRTLFFDPRLSRSGIVSCATCHNPGFQWSDGLRTGVGDGMNPLHRRTQTVLNLAWDELFFWDGRASSLEEQALGPIVSSAEMAMSLDSLIGRLSAVRGYAALFSAAYGVPTVTSDGIAKAIASYERTIVSATAPFDRWVAGDEAAISDEAKQGFDLFTGKARCAQCHAGWRFTDGGFYDIGIASKDLGRGEHIPGVTVLQYAFKAPTLRNVAERAPYLHDGSAATLEAVIDLYDRGGDVRRPSLSPEIVPLGLTPAEKRALVAFLGTLSSADPAVPVPVLPR